MPINFFDPKCKNQSKIKKFGLCDDPPPATDPAYIDEVNLSKWIATVENPNEKTVDFFAIDNCITILKADGNLESRCDGMLHYDNIVSFVELKNRAKGQWVKKGREQITSTLNSFSVNTDITLFSKIEGYVCNKQKPLVNTDHKIQIQKFKDDTGLILKPQGTIIV